MIPSGEGTQQEETGGYQVAMVMDTGVIDDKSFNQGTWEGVQKYCNENGITYKYYRSNEDDTASFEQTIEEAIGDKTEVVICTGFTFEVPVYNVQSKYPDIKFILIDGEPHNDDYSKFETTQNTMPILFHEDQSGFFAGYGSVMEGYTKIGFMGGKELPAVVRYGYGYLEGAEYAAEQLGTDVEVVEL